MAYERRRLSTESDKSSTSTTHSTESLTTKKSTVKQSFTMNSPAEILLARTKNTFIDLNPYFQCSSLPNHWRKNKSLKFILRAKDHVEIKANTRVVLLAGNDYNPSAILKNNISWFRSGQAEFNDLRFLSASGRGKKFTLSVIIETTPPQQCTYRRAIKITVDGPRKKREMKPKSDVNDMQEDESNFDADSDNETKIADTSIKPIMTQGSSGLLLLAAAAEQKRKDEEDEPTHQSIPIPYTSNCLSPSSSLASQFSQSIAFSPPSSDDHLSLHHHRQHVFLPNQSTNLILSLNSTQNRFDFYHPQQRRDSPTMVTTPTTPSPSSTSSNSHVLCR